MNIVTVAFVLLVILTLSQSSSQQECPAGCHCPGNKDGEKLTTDCSSYRGVLPESWPKSTTKLDLSNSNLTDIKWSSLAELSKLIELNLNGNPITCDCNYYKYWEQHVSSSPNVTLTGQCGKPDKIRGQSLATAGSQMADECGATPTLTPSTMAPGVMISERGSSVPMLEASQLVQPSTVSPPVTSSSEGMAVMPPLPPPPSSIDQSTTVSATAISPAVASTMLSTSTYAPLPPSPVAKTPTDAPTTTEVTSKTTTTSELTSTATIPTTTESPTTTEKPPTKTLPPTPPPPTTTDAQSTTTESPTTTEEPTTVKITPPPVPGPPIMSLYQLNPELKVGSVAQVVCQVEGLPKPSVRIIFNGKDTKKSNKFRVLNQGAKISFVVKYESEVVCYASNKFGRRKATLRVTVKDESTSYMMLNMKLIKEDYVQDYEDMSSSAFQNLQQRIKKQFDIIFNEFSGFYGASLVKVSSGSVIVDVLVKSTNSTKDRVMKVMEQELEDANFGSIPVDRYLFSIKPARACPGTYLNITWSDTVINGTAVEKCPREAKGMARRNCTERGWYYPDYTQCKSEPLTKVREEMELATNGSVAAPNMQILNTLEKVERLTVGNEEYSQMAGDLITCVEILEELTNYTKHERNDIAFNDEEIKLVVGITSNLLIKYNEQEFIVSQKLVQTASSLIRAVEEYGLQAAITVSNSTEDLRFFIAENVVMGAGTVVPLKITKDVTFPNYEIPELDAVRSAWKSSSFIVIDKQTIDEMYKVKLLKVAGFLYKTLTRILSAESAYSMVGQGFEINSAVVALSTEPKLKAPFKKPVIIASNNLDPVELDGDSPICAFWDFNLNPPNGGWSEKGCWYTHYNTQNTTCLCDHLTNFAVLREKPILIYAEQRSTPVVPPFLLCILIGAIIMICFCGITLFLLLLVAWRMKPDRTWAMHMFVCATLIVAFALIIVGLYTYNNVVFCQLLSILVHYFFLCAFTWIMAEATYMHVWSSKDGTKKRYWIGYFFIGFVPAGIPMAVAWVINGMYNFESPLSCWMSLFPSLIWVFFVPAIIYTLIAIAIFRQVRKSATGRLRVSLKALYWRTRFRVHVRYCIALLILFLLTWLFGVLVITYHLHPLQLVFCILFIVCCAITGLVILIFYVILDRQFDDGIRECCCYCCRGRRGKYRVKGDDYWEDGPPAEPEQPIAQEEPLIEEEHRRSPIIAFVTRPAPRSEPSMSSIDDPLYERVRKPGEEPPIKPEEEEKPPEAEPVYAKVRKSKTPEEEEEDPFPVPQEGSPRFLRGLTRQEVIRMAKKSDADKVELKKYESPKGSKDDIAEHPTYLLNQQEIDEELRHFRTFFAEGKHSPRPSTSTPSRTPPGTPTPSGIPRTQSASSSTSSTTRTKKVVKKTTKSTTSTSSFEKSETSEKKSVLSFESFESSSTVSHEKTTSQARAISPPRRQALPELEESETPPAPPPRAANLLDDDDDDDDERKIFLKDTKKTDSRDDKDDDSLTDVSADDLDKDSDDEESTLLDGSRPTAVPFEAVEEGEERGLADSLMEYFTVKGDESQEEWAPLRNALKEEAKEK